MSQPFALTIRAPHRRGYDIAEQLGFDDVMEALAISIFDDEGTDWVSVQALYESKDLAERASKSLKADLEYSIAELPDEDWVGLSQSGLPPIHAGRFLVHGSHDQPQTEGRIAILVDAGQAFGTGHHGTTKGCLLMMAQLQASGFHPKTILDLGTGAGILAIAAAKLWPDSDIVATDIDPVAVEVADRNASLNHVSFSAFAADGFDSPHLTGRQFDLIIANILAGPLRELAQPLSKALGPNGQAILSGILDEQTQWVSDAFERNALRITPQPSLEGWTSLLGRKG